MKSIRNLFLILGFAVIAFSWVQPAHADFVLTIQELDASNKVIATGGISTAGQSLVFIGPVGDYGVSVAGSSNSNTATTQGVVTNFTLDISSGKVTTGYTLRLILSDNRFPGGSGLTGTLTNQIASKSEANDGSATSFGLVDATNTPTVKLSGSASLSNPIGSSSSSAFVLKGNTYTLGNELDIHMGGSELAQYSITTTATMSTVMPEPGTLTLLLSGAPMMLVGLYLRRHKQRMQIA